MDHTLSHASGLLAAALALVVFTAVALAGVFEALTGPRRRQTAALVVAGVAGTLTVLAGVATFLALASNIARVARG